MLMFILHNINNLNELGFDFIVHVHDVILFSMCYIVR